LGGEMASSTCKVGSIVDMRAGLTVSARIMEGQL